MRLWADFNDIHHHNRTSTSLRFASSPRKLATGERVELYDGVEEGDGNRCWATVTDIKGSIIYLELDWSTWTPAESEEARVARVI